MKYFLAVCFSLYLLPGVAQQTNTDKQDVGIIIGNVIDSSGKAAAYANLTLYLLNDSIYRKTTIADKTGAFEFNNLRFGYYRLSVNSVGFAPLHIDSIYIRAERFDFNLGDLKLLQSSSQLADVIVYAEKPLIENRDGKLTYNVGESALSSGSTTSEILKTLPLINNDPNGKILLKGKEPKILIDDKPTDLNAQQLQDLLESLPGSSIDKIELMLNPPPQYANESGGVINIVTKKGKIGWVGKMNLSGGTRGEGNFGVNLSYREKKTSVNLHLGVGANQTRGNNYSRRENLYADSSNYFHTDGNYHNKNYRPNLRAQWDYEKDKKKSFSIVYQGNLNFFDNNSRTQYTNLNKSKDIYRLSTRENSAQGTGYNHGLTLSYTLKGKTAGEVLRLHANGNFGKNDNDRDFFQQFLNPNYLPTGVDSTQEQLTDNYSNAYSLRINYDRPFKTKGSSFSAGAFYQRNNNHNVLNTQFLRKSDSIYVINDLLSNDFRFHQDILNFRSALTWTFPREWRITAGVIAELTQMNFNFLKGNATNVSNDYWNVMPHVNIRKEFSKELNTSLVYRRSIRRPGIGELNPSVDYGDPYNIRFGNPYLLPQLADNFDWNVSWIMGKYYINTSVGYNRVRNIFNTIRTLIEAGKTQVTWQNIASRNEYEASIWGGYTFSKKLRMNASAGFTYNEYSEVEKQAFKFRNGGTFYTSLNYNFLVNSLLTFEGNTRYSSFADPQGRSRSNLTMNLGVQRKFFNRRLTVSFNAIDPFRQQRFNTFTYGKNFVLESFNATQTRNFRLAVSYQLNKVVQKKAVSDKQKKDAIEKAKQKKVN